MTGSKRNSSGPSIARRRLIARLANSPWMSGRRLVGAVLAATALLAAACSGGESAAPTTLVPATVPLSELPPGECVPQGWAQDPLLAATLGADPNIAIDSLPDVEQVRAMDIVVGCFDRAAMVQAFDAATSPFDFPTQSAECMADTMIANQSGAAFIGFGSYAQGTAPVITEVDIRTPTVEVLTGCVPPSAFGYGVVLAPFLQSVQNGAVDVACADRAYNEQADGIEFWGATYDQVVLDQNTADVNRILFEPGFYCVSFGTAYAASVKADLGEDLSASTVACMDRQLAIENAVELLITTGTNKELIDAAAEGCFTPDERTTFGLDGGG